MLSTPVGKMRHRFTVQQRTAVRATDGGYAPSWSTLMTLNGAILTLADIGGHGNHPGSKPDGREYQFAGATTSDSEMAIHCRAQVTKITQDMRIVFGARVFNILSSIQTNQIRHEAVIWVRETTGVVAESATVSANLKSYPWGEIDFTTTQTIAISVDAGKRFFPNKVEAVVSTLGGTVTIQPTIKVGIGSDHTKYLSSKLFTILDTLYNRQTFETLLADQGETDLWMEVSVAGAVSAGSYRGSIVIFGDQIQ